MKKTKAKPQKTGNQMLPTALKIIGLLAWTFIGISIAATIIGTLMLTFFRDSSGNPLWSTAYTALTYVLAVAIVIFLPAKIKKLNLGTSKEELGLTDPPKWRDLGLGVAGLIVSLLFVMLLFAIFSWLFSWFDPQETQNVGYTFLPDIPSRFLAFFALVVAAPVAEELIFRGWLYAKLRRHANLWLSTILVSLLFAVAHSPLAAAINAFGMSIIMCLIREMTSTIWAPLILHVLKNGLAFFLLISTGML